MNLPAMNPSNEKTSGRGKTVGWKEVRVFVSSTFDDMHAERDSRSLTSRPKMGDFCCAGDHHR